MDLGLAALTGRGPSATHATTGSDTSPGSIAILFPIGLGVAAASVAGLYFLGKGWEKPPPAERERRREPGEPPLDQDQAARESEHAARVETSAALTDRLRRELAGTGLEVEDELERVEHVLDRIQLGQVRVAKDGKAVAIVWPQYLDYEGLTKDGVRIDLTESDLRPFIMGAVENDLPWRMLPGKWSRASSAPRSWDNHKEGVVQALLGRRPDLGTDTEEYERPSYDDDEDYDYERRSEPPSDPNQLRMFGPGTPADAEAVEAAGRCVRGEDYSAFVKASNDGILVKYGPPGVRASMLARSSAPYETVPVPPDARREDLSGILATVCPTRRSAG
jgi:hypothetical protein